MHTYRVVQVYATSPEDATEAARAYARDDLGLTMTSSLPPTLRQPVETHGDRSIYVVEVYGVPVAPEDPEPEGDPDADYERWLEQGGAHAEAIAAEDAHELELEALDPGLQAMRQAREERMAEHSPECLSAYWTDGGQSGCICHVDPPEEAKAARKRYDWRPWSGVIYTHQAAADQELREVQAQEPKLRLRVRWIAGGFMVQAHVARREA